MRGANGYGLFEVFTQEWLDKEPLRKLDRDHATIQSIQDHLSRLLNARRGALSHLPDYGLPDLTAAYGNLAYTIKELQSDIQKCIAKYEPRISDVEVIQLPEDRVKGVILLEIRATLLSGLKTRFETHLKSEGYATVIQSPVYD
jgi:type VI secretion system protein